jgi:hypothetical protein
METSFTEVWTRIIGHEGETFYTKKHLPFSYRIDGDYFLPSRTKYKVRKSDFEKAYAKVPFDGPGKVNWTVRGPSYIWAVLHDQRIRQNDW